MPTNSNIVPKPCLENFTFYDATDFVCISFQNPMKMIINEG